MKTDIKKKRGGERERGVWNSDMQGAYRQSKKKKENVSGVNWERPIKSGRRGSDGGEGKKEKHLSANCTVVNVRKGSWGGKKGEKTDFFFLDKVLTFDDEESSKFSVMHWANGVWKISEHCAPASSCVIPSPTPRINYGVSVTADGSPTLPCSHCSFRAKKRQVQPKVVSVRKDWWNVLKTL